MRAIGAAKIAADSQAMSGRSKPMTHTWTAGLAVIVTGLLCGSVNGEWRNAMKPQGDPAGRLTVVEGGKPACVIQCVAQPTGPETKAARDLQQWIREMTGATVEIADVERSGNAVVIRTDRSLGDEGYEIAIEKNRLVLSGGRTRGAINAVYALLEEDLGCRFYTNESIRLPRSDTLVVAPVARRCIPRLKVRDPFYAFAFDAVWSLRNRTNAQSARVLEEYGGYVDYDGMYVHTAAPRGIEFFISSSAFHGAWADGGGRAWYPGMCRSIAGSMWCA
jgi:hypothetical protein